MAVLPRRHYLDEYIQLIRQQPFNNAGCHFSLPGPGNLQRADGYFRKRSGNYQPNSLYHHDRQECAGFGYKFHFHYFSASIVNRLRR